VTLQTWQLFVIAVFLLSGSPGPNMLHVMSRSLNFGFQRGMASMAGCLTAIVLVLAASAAGLTALLLAVPGAFEVMRWVGAGYLVYLGIQAWRGGETPMDLGPSRLSASPRLSALYRDGFLISVSNPKLLLFAAAFLPQFIDQNLPRGPQFAVLVVTFAVIESGWYAVYGLGGRRLATLLTRPPLQQAFNRLTGVVFIGFGLALLWAHA
jgi:threonine/homoserine/homoserine lactone efflux protein